MLWLTGIEQRAAFITGASMRTIVAILALRLALPAMAQSAHQPCFTEDSVTRAQAVLTARLQQVNSPRPELNGQVVLDCMQQADASIRCAILQETASPYQLGQAALASAAELRTCSPEPQRFYRRFDFYTTQ
jgi:hypothetical protein